MNNSKNEKHSGIYKITNTTNNKVYIGQSIDIHRRWDEHLRRLASNRHENAHLQSAWNCYGRDAFIFEIIDECAEKDLNNKEMYYIDHYQSYKNEYGYNNTLGGGGTVYENKVLQFDAFGNLIKEYRNGIAAGNETGLSISCIYGCCTRRLKKVGNFIFVYKDDYIKNPECLNWYLNSNRNTPVEQYDLYGNLIKTWSSCAEIVRETDFNPIGCLTHISKSHRGYIWKRINDESIKITKSYCDEVRHSVMKLLRRKIYQYDKDYNLIHVYSSFRDAAKDRFCRVLLKQCLEEGREFYKGYRWSYEELGVA